MVERTQIKAGMFLTSGPPATGDMVTKVLAVKSLEEIDEKFDEAARMQAMLEKTRAAIAALKSKI